MVPFADIFNHKASVVSLGGDFELAGACLGAAGSASEADEPNGASRTTSRSPHSTAKTIQSDSLRSFVTLVFSWATVL